MASTASTGHMPRSIFKEEASSSGQREFHSSGTASIFEEGSSQDSSGVHTFANEVVLSSSATMIDENIQNLTSSTAGTVQNTGTVLITNTTNSVFDIAAPVRGSEVKVQITGSSSNHVRIVGITTDIFFGQTTDNKMIESASDISAGPNGPGRTISFFSTGTVRWRISNIDPSTADIVFSTALTS